MKKFRKFTDTEFLKFYNRKVSDTRMAKIFSVSHGIIRNRRQKLGLVAHYRWGNKKILNEEETKEAFRINRKDISRRKRIRFCLIYKY